MYSVIDADEDSGHFLSFLIPDVYFQDPDSGRLQNMPLYSS